MVKRGYIRTIEAIIAILILFGFIIFVIQKSPEVLTKVPESVSNAQRSILDQIANDEALRNCVLSYDLEGNKHCTDFNYFPQGPDCRYNNNGYDNTTIEVLIENTLPSNYGYACEICPQTLSCAQDLGIPIEEDIFTDTTLITNGVKTRLVRLYIWEKN